MDTARNLSLPSVGMPESAGNRLRLVGATQWQSRAFTAIELLTVIAVVGILASLALPSFSRLMATTQVKSASTNVYLALTKARSEAIKRNAAVTISPNAGGWQSGWTIFPTATPANILARQGALTGVTVTTVPTSLASVVYVNSGRIRGGVAPSFSLVITGKSWEQRCVSADATGRPYVKAAAC